MIHINPLCHTLSRPRCLLLAAATLLRARIGSSALKCSDDSCLHATGGDSACDRDADRLATVIGGGAAVTVSNGVEFYCDGTFVRLRNCASGANIRYVNPMVSSGTAAPTPPLGSPYCTCAPVTWPTPAPTSAAPTPDDDFDDYGGDDQGTGGDDYGDDCGGSCGRDKCPEGLTVDFIAKECCEARCALC